jgi:predicted N-formylglutamate amidohydrolase
MKSSLIITCEHAGNEVPEEYQSLFIDQQEILSSHRGWDPGAWLLARHLSKQLGAPLFGCLTSRLLIEANRSLDSDQLFSEFTTSLSKSEKENLIQQIYRPYRDHVIAAIERVSKPLLHLSIHSFTPTWNKQERKVDIGILFDPSRNSEYRFSQQLRENLQLNLPEFQIDFNEPYKGTDDGFTSWLRTEYNDAEYAGIEIEVNQKFAPKLSIVEEALFKSIKASMHKYMN